MDSKRVLVTIECSVCILKFAELSRFDTNGKVKKSVNAQCQLWKRGQAC